MNKKYLNKYFELENIVQYGDFYKIKNYENIKENNNSKLILVTSINPTPVGEGKTTTLIGINDCLNYYNQKSIAVLRQPSMGPFFGVKGGATGSGKCELINADKINCGLTGDFFAIESANNLIMAVIENEIYQNSDLNIDPQKILWNRCIDTNDRSLREINYNINEETNIKSSFNITAASYLMAAFCLAKSKDDFKENLLNTIVAFSKENKPICIKDLNIIDILMMIMDDALNPNIAFSKYNNPVIIHGGPFANIAHGCNSIIATNIGLKISDYVLTEAGFGIDLGAEKFLNIKTRITNRVPNLVIITVTIKALKYHGGVKIDDLNNENIDAIRIGYSNLEKNIKSIEKFNLNYVIIINRFDSDTNNEVNTLVNLCQKNNHNCLVSTMWQNGPIDNEHIAKFIINNLSNNKINYTYNLNDDVITKAKNIAKTIYGADDVIFSDNALKIINDNSSLIDGYFVCFAKTFSSLSDDPKKLNLPTNFKINVTDAKINFAAKFIILITSKIFLMPGLPKNPKAKRIKYEHKK